MSMYYMILAIGGNETAPSSMMLKFYSAAAILIGTLGFTGILSSIVDYISVISRRH